MNRKKYFLHFKQLRKKEGNPNWKGGKPKCIDCNKILSNYNNKRCKKCSNRLNNLGRKRKQWEKDKISKTMLKKGSTKGKNNGNFGKYGKNSSHYIHGKGNFPYPLEFNNKLKEQIRKRDNYTCQNCGLTEKEHLNKYNQSLTIHHIDYNKNNCDKNNLITLCNKCNSKANSNIDYWYAYFHKIIDTKKDHLSE